MGSGINVNLNVTRYNAIVDNIVNIEGQNIVVRSTARWSCRGTWYPFCIGGHGEKNQYQRIDRQVGNLTRPFVPRKGGHAHKVLLVKMEDFLRGIVDRNWKKKSLIIVVIELICSMTYWLYRNRCNSEFWHHTTRKKQRHPSHWRLLYSF